MCLTADATGEAVWVNAVPANKAIQAIGANRAVALEKFMVASASGVTEDNSELARSVTIGDGGRTARVGRDLAEVAARR